MTARKIFTDKEVQQVLSLAQESLILSRMGNRVGSWLAYQEMSQVPATKEVA